MKPYRQDKSIRKFYRILNRKGLVWHRDVGTRRFLVIKGQGWRLQFDRRVPILLEENKTYTIPDMVFHRLLKGKTNLIIKFLQK